MNDDREPDESGDDEATTPDGLSLHPLSPEDALAGFLRVDPEKVKEAERREKKARSRKRKKRRKADG